MEIHFLLIVFFLSILAIGAFIAYKFVIKPKALMESYTKQFQANNWKVLKLPFLPFDSFYRLIVQYEDKSKKDCHWELKNVWSQYDAVVTNFADRPYIQLVNPQLAKQYYELQSEKTYMKYKALTTQLQRMLGLSIAFAEGGVWKQKRKIMTQFLNFSFIKSITSKIDMICKRKVNMFYENKKVQGEKRNQKQVSEVHIQDMIEMINSTVIAEIFFGGGKENVDSLKIDGKTLPSFMRELMEELLWQTVNPVSVLLGVRFVELGLRERDRKCNAKLKIFREEITRFIHLRMYEISEEISKNGQISQPKDLMEAFYLQMKGEMSKKQKQEFIENLINDFANLYAAGTDTTQHATMMMIYFVNQNPAIKQRLLEELQQSKINVESLTFDSIKNLTYLEAISLETVRMYQTGNGIFPREVLEPVTIGGVRFEKGTALATQTFPVHYNEKYYERASVFMPERWIDEQGKIKSPQPYCFNSFSNGIRSCIGKQLALQEMKLFAVYFCSKFQTEFQTLDLVMNLHGFAYEPQPIKMKFWPK